MGKKLYIIGNGFDLHNNNKSAYEEFGKWLELNNHEDFIMELNEIIRTPEGESKLWSNLEDALARVDLKNFKKQLIPYIVYKYE